MWQGLLLPQRPSFDLSHVASTRRVLSRSRCCPRNGDQEQPQDRPKGTGDRAPKKDEEECEEDKVHKGPNVDEDVEESAGLVICQSVATPTLDGGWLTKLIPNTFLVPCAASMVAKHHATEMKPTKPKMLPMMIELSQLRSSQPVP